MKTGGFNKTTSAGKVGKLRYAFYIYIASLKVSEARQKFEEIKEVTLEHLEKLQDMSQSGISYTCRYKEPDYEECGFPLNSCLPFNGPKKADDEHAYLTESKIAKIVVEEAENDLAAAEVLLGMRPRTRA